MMHPETTIIDTVSFENLVVSDKPYRMVGILMDQQTGEPLLAGGKEVTAEYNFVAKKESGSLQMEFVFDSSALKGKSVVVFERLYYGENLITEHCSIDDPGQTVKFLEPNIRTLAASDTGEKDLIIHPETKIIDTVEFENLFVSDTPYRMVGILMDQATEQPLLVDGKEVTAEYSFTALKESGSVTMEFVLNSMDLAGKTVVVYEELYYDTALVSEHKAIDDSGQSVKFLTPNIRTSARGEDGTKVIPVSGTAKVIDTISYENLPVGEEFEVSGVLMNRETGKPAMVDGKEITASAKFVPTTPSGTVDVEFIFDSTGLQDTILVVFETLVHVETEKEICEHKDLADDAQTVGVGIEVLADEPEPTTSGGGAKTGGNFPVWLLIVAIISGAAAVLLISRKKAKVQK